MYLSTTRCSDCRRKCRPHRQSKNRFWKSPLDVEKKNSSDQVFIKAMLWHSASRFQNGITLRYWKYFLEIVFQKIGKNILKNIFDQIFTKKYLQYPSVIPFWNREAECHNMALLKTWSEEFFFSTSKGDFQKRFLDWRCGRHFLRQSEHLVVLRYMPGMRF